jgi:hypothetical protein
MQMCSHSVKHENAKGKGSAFAALDQWTGSVYGQAWGKHPIKTKA